jgi:hypothetical protein
MPRRKRTVAFLALAAAVVALPARSFADEPTVTRPASGSLALNFAAPKGWTDETRPSNRPGLWRDWAFRDGGGVVHSIVLSLTRESQPAAAYGPAAVAYFKTAANVSLIDSGPTTTCGDVPAFRYSYRSERTPGHPLVIVHVLVDIAGLLGDVSYAHPPDVADRADALDALSTMCDQKIYAMRAPAGWQRGGVTAKNAPGVDGFTTPGSRAALIALAVPAPVPSHVEHPAPTTVNPPATLVSDVEEPCGALHVRHAVFRSEGPNGAGTMIAEDVAGYRHGVSYLYSYVRPAAERADPEAQRALTSFCDPNATLATPVPTAAATPSPSPV